jgi:hypothetical protein
VLALTVELEAAPPPLPLPAPPPVLLAPYLPEFTRLPDDTTLLFTPHGFTVRRLAGLAGDALQALWVYAYRELEKVRPVATPPTATQPPVHHRGASSELVQLYRKEEQRLRQLQALQARADAQLQHVCKAFLDAYNSYQETSTELRQQQEILAKLKEAYVLQPQQPFCHHSSLLAQLQRKMQWPQWFVRQAGQLTCTRYPTPPLQRWYAQACVCQLSEERQSSRTVTRHPDGTTVQHESHSHRRTVQWKTQMLPELLHMAQDSETHYQDHQFRIDWMEHLLHSLHDMHLLLMAELHALQVLASHSAAA